MPDKDGRFKGISVPALPWKEKHVAKKQVKVQPNDEGGYDIVDVLSGEVMDHADDPYEAKIKRDAVNDPLVDLSVRKEQTE